MTSTPRFHWAWVIAPVAFVTLIGAAGFRSVPGVLMDPLHTEFGWSHGTIGAAVTVSLRRGGLIAPVLILPLSIPILIFGTGAIAAAGAAGSSAAALLFLAAISLVTLALAPFAAALALRLAED